MRARLGGDGDARWLILGDGRRLAFAEVGAPEGVPVMAFHGAPGSRLSLAGAGAPDARGERLRVICPDRPGIGRSDPQPGRTLVDWPRDVAQLADALGIGRFAAFGGSAGGVYALACGAVLGARVRRVAVVNTPAPMHWPGVWRGHPAGARAAWWAIGHVPGMARFTAGVQHRAARGGPWLVRLVARRMAAEDRAVLADPTVRAAVARHFREAYRQGAAGMARDLRLIARPWGFSPADVTVPVDLWQGLRDRNVPPAMGRALAAALPHCRARFLPGTGHLPLAEALDEVRAALGADASAVGAVGI